MEKHKVKRVMVTGAGGASGLSTIRLLRKTTNYEIIAADAAECAAVFLFANEKLVLPLARDESYTDKILSIMENKKVDLLIPNVDEELSVLSALQHSKILISPASTISICLDKLKTIAHLRETISVPSVYDYSTIKEDGSVFPLFLKPRESRGSRNVFCVKNIKHLKSIVEYLKCEGFTINDLMITEYLPGDEYTVECLFDKDGRLIVCLPRIRMATNGSVCTIGHVVRDEAIKKIITKISKKLKFCGPINVQFKKDVFGTLKLLEINPRLAGSTPISYESGINFPKLSCKQFFNEVIYEDEKDFKETTVYRILEEH